MKQIKLVSQDLLWHRYAFSLWHMCRSYYHLREFVQIKKENNFFYEAKACGSGSQH